MQQSEIPACDAPNKAEAGIPLRFIPAYGPTGEPVWATVMVDKAHTVPLQKTRDQVGRMPSHQLREAERKLYAFLNLPCF